MNNYVVGFAFNKDKNKVALIRKNRPEWQDGKLNGIGGHIENDESPIHAMVREFQEETGKLTDKSDWDLVCLMKEEDSFACYVFRSFIDLNNIRTTTDEVVGIYSIDGCYKENKLSNLSWLIPLCLDDNDNMSEYTCDIYKIGL